MLEDRDPAQLEDPHAAGERLGDGAEEAGCGGAEEHHSAPRLSVEKAPQRGKQRRQPLGFVEHEALMLREQEREVCVGSGEVDGMLQVQVREVGKCLAGKRGLADLARAQDRDGGKPPGQ